MSEIPKMIQTMRWFGPQDPVSLEFIKMAGASGIVTSLHHIDDGRAWGVSEIQKRKETIESYGLTWNVVESLTPHDDIKLRAGNYQHYLQNYCTTLRHLGACGVRTVCYNFMTLLDWMRTDLNLPFHDGSLALAFDWRDLAVFDIYVMRRKNAEKDYAHLFPEGLDDYYNSLSKTRISTLIKNILKGLPGTDESWTPEDLNHLSERFRSISRERLRENLIEFLNSFHFFCPGIYKRYNFIYFYLLALSTFPNYGSAEIGKGLMKKILNRFFGIRCELFSFHHRKNRRGIDSQHGGIFESVFCGSTFKEGCDAEGSDF